MKSDEMIRRGHKPLVGLNKTSKTRGNYTVWVDGDDKPQKLNIMSNEDRLRLGLPICEELENQPKEPQDEKR